MSIFSDQPDTTVDLKVPDLPTNLDKKEKTKKEKTKPKRHLIEQEDDLFKYDPSVSIIAHVFTKNF